MTLTVTQEEIQDGFLLRFEIVDTGVGIDAAALPQLFKPFHQANVSIARQYGGSGLGLTIAKSVGGLFRRQAGTLTSQALVWSLLKIPAFSFFLSFFFTFLLLLDHEHQYS